MIISELTETVRLAFSALRTTKLRSFLASLGVVIGITLVIMMGWMLAGLDKAMLDTINSLGVDMLYIDKWPFAGAENWDEIRKRGIITRRQYQEFERKMTGAEYVFPMVGQWSATIQLREKSYQGFRVIGTNAEFSESAFGEIGEGRNFSKFEEQSGDNVVVLGNKVYTTIFPNGAGIGKFIRLKGIKYRVIGVITKQASALEDEFDIRSYIPLKSFLKTYGSKNKNFSIAIKAGSEDKMDDVRAEAFGIMRNIRNIGPGDKDDFSINEIKAFDRMIGNIRKTLWGIGIGMTVLSFTVGIIGIMNIMFVSVTERTKEIGIRKSIGAKRRSIWMQFLVEASTLSFMGAMVAIVICSVIVWAVTTFLTDNISELRFLQPYLPVQLVIISSFVSIFVGIMAGLIPAVRASRLNPVDALRYD